MKTSKNKQLIWNFVSLLLPSLKLIHISFDFLSFGYPFKERIVDFT